MYNQQSIKSTNVRAEEQHKHMLSGAKSRTPCDWKSFMSNHKKKIKLISLLLDQWTTDKYATRLEDKNQAHVHTGKCIRRFGGIYA